MTFTTDDRINAEKNTCMWTHVSGVYDDFWSTSCNQLIPIVNIEKDDGIACVWCQKTIVKKFKESMNWKAKR